MYLHQDEILKFCYVSPWLGVFSAHVVYPRVYKINAFLNPSLSLTLSPATNNGELVLMHTHTLCMCCLLVTKSGLRVLVFTHCMVVRNWNHLSDTVTCYHASKVPFHGEWPISFQADCAIHWTPLVSHNSIPQCGIRTHSPTLSLQYTVTYALPPPPPLQLLPYIQNPLTEHIP